MPAVGVWQAGERRIGWRSQANFQVFPAGRSSLLCAGPTSISATSHFLKRRGGRIHTEPLSAILCRVARSGTLIAYSPSLLRKHCWEIFRSSWNHQQCLKTCQFNSCVLLGPRWKKWKCVAYIIVGAFVGLPPRPLPMVLINCFWSAVYLPSSNPGEAGDSGGNQTFTRHPPRYCNSLQPLPFLTLKRKYRPFPIEYQLKLCCGTE